MNYSVILIVVMAIGTMLLRFAPFLIFKKGQIPSYITYLGTVLPFSAMGMLVIYCLKDVDLFSGNHGLPELAASLAIIFIHVWKRNTILSILAGTIIYMFLVQIMF